MAGKSTADPVFDAFIRYIRLLEDYSRSENVAQVGGRVSKPRSRRMGAAFLEAQGQGGGVPGERGLG
jgi:hypothetical protein